MKLGIPKETAKNERRVAATPDSVKKAVSLGLSVVVETGAGEAAAMPDAAYRDAGAKFAARAADVFSADIVFVVAPPDGKSIQSMKQGATLIGMLNPLGDTGQAAAYAKAGINAFAMELLPRITRAQSMDVLSSQSNIAGYGAALLAATHYPRMFPMMMTAAGTVTPARVLVLGAGVAGLQAIATAKRLGAVVLAYDVRPEVKEQVESLGASFVAVEEAAESGAAEGGYAKEMSANYKKKEQATLAAEVARADVVITTALIPGRPAPELITKKMAAAMKPGSVVVDLAAEAGGNCACTRADQVVQENGVTFVGTTNLPSLWAADTSKLLARNLMTFLEPMLSEGAKSLNIDLEDEIVSGTLLTQNGKVVHPRLTG